MAQIRIDDDVYERLKQSAEQDKRTIGQQIEYLLGNRIVLEDIAESLRQTPTEKKEEQKPAGLQPVRTAHVVQSELWAVEKRLKNILSEVQDKAVEESWTDEESVSYAHHLENDLNEQRRALAEELTTLV